MNGTAMDTTLPAPGTPTAPGAGGAWAADGEAAPSWHALGLPTMSSMLLQSFARQGSHSYAARCQWPRLHPLNDRMPVVRHHPLLMLESTRQIALALARWYPAPAGHPPCEPVSAGLGLRPESWPGERGCATDLQVRIGVSDLLASGTGAAAFRVTAEYLHGGVPIGSCTVKLAGRVPGAPGRRCAAPRLLHPPAAAVGAGCEETSCWRGARRRLVIAPRDPGHPVLLPGAPSSLTATAVLEAGRQAVLLTSGRTSAAVAGLRLDLTHRVPVRGARVDVAWEHGGSRFLVTSGGVVAATGSVVFVRS
ncbi:hypothetical protein ACFQ60_01330 [Streptomyces zhihengii]